MSGKARRGLRLPNGWGFYGLLTLLALLAMALILVSTTHGAGVGGDATIYIVSARNLLEGRGLGLIEPDGSFRLLPYFAPLFSLVLALLGKLGATDLAHAARWLNLFLFAGLVWLAGAVTFRVTRAALWGLLAAMLLLVSPILIPVYSWAMSEPLALFLGFVGLWLAFLTARRPNNWVIFLASAFLTGLSFLTRYSSFAFVLTGAWLLLFFRPGGWLSRLKFAFLYGAVAALPMLPWLALNLARTATVSSRSLESAAGMLSRFAGFWPQFLDAALSWVIPFSWIEQPFYPALLNRLLPLILLAGLLAWLVFALREQANTAPAERDPRLWALALALLAGSYLLVILLVYITTYPPITIENRMLSPMHAATLWLVVMLASAARPKARWLTAALPLVVLLFAGWSYLRSARIIEQNAIQGLGYSSLEWRTSETIRAVGFLSPDTTIVTNEVTALLYLTGRSAYALQEIYRDQPATVFNPYGSGDLESDEAQRLFARGEAVLVLFDSLASQLEPVYGEQAAARAEALVDGLVLIYDASDGTIYIAPAGVAP